MTSAVSLAGKRVLFIAPRFFGYDTEICDELARRGAHVTSLFDRPFTTPFMTAVTKKAPGLVARAALPGYRAILESSDPFDLIFVINGQTLSGAFLTEARRHSPAALLVLYLWDALSNRPSILPLLPHYDRIFSFEREDAQTFGLLYRPSFFSSQFESRYEEERFDISFVGTAHTDRAQVLWRLDSGLDSNIRRFWYLYLQAPWVRRYYSLRSGSFRSVPKSVFTYAPMDKSKIGRLFHQSRAILDIEHPQQRGLSMRTWETLGAGKKLITTNQSVINEEFYHPDNVLVIDRNFPRVSQDFIRKPSQPISSEIKAYYSLAGWLDEIMKRDFS